VVAITNVACLEHQPQLNHSTNIWNGLSGISLVEREFDLRGYGPPATGPPDLESISHISCKAAALAC
jgi:hypothetical protein